MRGPSEVYQLFVCPHSPPPPSHRPNMKHNPADRLKIYRSCARAHASPLCHAVVPARPKLKQGGTSTICRRKSFLQRSAAATYLLIRALQQIPNLFVVDLDVLHSERQRELRVLSQPLLCLVKDLLADAGDQAPRSSLRAPVHAVRLAAPGRTVCEETAVGMRSTGLRHGCPCRDLLIHGGGGAPLQGTHPPTPPPKIKKTSSGEK